VASGISKINREHAPSADNIEIMMTGYRKAESIDKELKNSQSGRRLALAGDILKAVLSDPAVPMEQREAIKSRIPILVVSQSSQ
jgi:hypothetical protein